MPNFIAALRDRQGDESDEDFAKRLGISRAHWTRLRRGERQPTRELVRRAWRLWPELVDVYLNDERAWITREAC